MISPISRRAALQHLVGGTPCLAAVSSLATALAAEADPLTVIDTHTHFFDPTRKQGVPWPGKDSPLYRKTLSAEYRAAIAPQRVSGTVVVEASPWLEDNQWLLDVADADPFIVGIVGHLEPGEAEFQNHLERFAKHKLFRGIRVGSAAVKKGLAGGTLVADVKRLAEHDLELDVNGGPDMPADVARLAERLPELRIVINHMANVEIDGRTPPDAWLQGMAAAAKHPHVYCKISALLEEAARNGREAPADVEFYRPALDAVWSLFGDDRVIFGSNWPVCERAGGFAKTHQVIEAFMRSKSRAVQEKFFSKNALAAYKWIKR